MELSERGFCDVVGLDFSSPAIAKVHSLAARGSPDRAFRKQARRPCPSPLPPPSEAPLLGAQCLRTWPPSDRGLRFMCADMTERNFPASRFDLVIGARPPAPCPSLPPPPPPSAAPEHLFVRRQRYPRRTSLRRVARRRRARPRGARRGRAPPRPGTPRPSPAPPRPALRNTSVGSRFGRSATCDPCPLGRSATCDPSPDQDGGPEPRRAAQRA